MRYNAKRKTGNAVTGMGICDIVSVDIVETGNKKVVRIIVMRYMV